MRKPTFWFLTWSDTNQAVELQKMARGLKFRLKKVEELYYLCSENKGADQLRGYREADLRLCLRICKCWFSHDAAHFIFDNLMTIRLQKEKKTSPYLCFLNSKCGIDCPCAVPGKYGIGWHHGNISVQK